MGKSTNSQVHNFDALNNQPLNSAAKLGFEQALSHAWSDPSRLYSSSRKSRQLLEAARSSIAQNLDLEPSEIFFAPGFPYIFSHLVTSLMKSENRKNKKILLSEVEQSALLSAASNYQHLKLTVNDKAQVAAEEFIENLTPDVGLAILQLANHEVGTRQPVVEVYQACKAKKIPLLVDASMTFDLSEIKDDFDVLVLNPISWQGPAGLTVVAVKEGVEFTTSLRRDKRENKKFPAFPNVPLAISTAAALEETTQKLPALRTQMQEIQKKIIEQISAIPGLQVLTDTKNSLSNIICAIFEDIDGEALVSELDKRGFEISSGSSCIADEIAPSHVMQAIGVGPAVNIRITLPLNIDEVAALQFANSLTEVVERLRSEG